jgi:hypothetical protein
VRPQPAHARPDGHGGRGDAPGDCAAQGAGRRRRGSCTGPWADAKFCAFDSVRLQPRSTPPPKNKRSPWSCCPRRSSPRRACRPCS